MLTSLTVMMVVVVLYVLGGPTIHGFAFAMVVGTITGVYSTVFVASPLFPPNPTSRRSRPRKTP